ncbi:protein borderless isoform X1 [Diprion similis]|uniref:protein borderless isoform X1 n=1 Tax=Diprion similis TaxID=362088 RepID=UPI001EF77720|nr:protein borderless isoform X1 [Diprion similis]
MRNVGTFLVALLFCKARGFAHLLEEEKEPTFLTASVGGHIVFNCDLDFPHDLPIPYILRWNHEGTLVYSWYDGELIETDDYAGRIHLIGDGGGKGYGQGSINLTSIRETDQGWYECRVIFPNRTPSSRNNGTWVHLTIDVGADGAGSPNSSREVQIDETRGHTGVPVRPPIVTGENLLAVPPINQTTMEGNTANFACVTKDTSSVVNWYRDGVAISDIEELRDRATIRSDGTLTITSAAMSDLGEYTCTITSPNNERQSATAFLNVQYKAKVIYAPREVYLPYGRPGLLDCHFRANPPLTNLRWDKDGFLFDPYNVQGVFYRRNGSLYFSKVNETHSGSYTCTPFNNLGTEGPSPPINVIVQRPPVFTVTPQNFYIQKLGESIEIPCDARDGDQTHRPTIVWFKDGTPLSSDRVAINGGNLTIERIQEEDRGVYQCAASNEAATVVADAELMVLDAPPRAPYNLSATSSRDTVILRWVPGFVRPKMEYSVWYRPTDTSEWRTMKILSRKTTEATINNLTPGREYEFMVLSKYKHGDGMFSKALRIHTKPSAIDENSASEFRSPKESSEYMSTPRNLRVQPAVEGYLVTWDPPAQGSDLVRVYTVRWFRGPLEQLYGMAETTDTSYLVKTLEEESYYTFEVTAMSLSDDFATSDRFGLEVPAYRRNRAISMGIVAGIGFLAAALAAVWWARKKFCRGLSNEK